MRRHFKVLVIVGCGCSVALLLTAYVLRRSRTGKKPLSKSLDTKQDDSELSVIESDSGIAKDEDPASATSGSSSYTSCEEELPETPETDSSNNSDSSAPINILPQGGGGGHTRDFRQKTIPDRREFDTPNNSGSRVLDIRRKTDFTSRYPEFYRQPYFVSRYPEFRHPYCLHKKWRTNTFR